MNKKYHLGCGSKYIKGYINVDFPQEEHTIVSIKADIYSDLIELNYLPCSEIRSHHVFEHFDYIQSVALLFKWTKALTIDGILRIDLPNIQLLCKGLDDAETNKPLQVFKFIRMIYGSHEAKWAFHINGWTENSLTYVLDKMGFSLKNARKYGNISDRFPNCGIDMTFNKIREIPNLKEICYNTLKLYTCEMNEEPLYNYYCRKLDELC